MNNVLATRVLLLGAAVLLVLNWFIFREVMQRPTGSEAEGARAATAAEMHKQVAVDIIELQLERKETRIRQLERDLELATQGARGGGGRGAREPQVLSVGWEWSGRKTRKVTFHDGNSAYVYATTYEGSMASPDQPTVDWWDKVENRWWEMDTYNIYKTFIGPQSSFIDFGAWIGPTVLYGATLAKAAYALEPDPYAFDELRANIALNPELQAKTKVYWRCIMDKPGIYPMGGGGGDSMATVGQGAHPKSWKVDCLTLPHFIEEHQIENLDLIKMDTEGAEHIILPSFKSWLMKQTPTTRPDVESERAFGKCVIVLVQKKPTLWLSIHKWNFGPGGEEAVLDVLRLYRRVLEGDSLTIDLNTYVLCNFCTILATDSDAPIYRG